MSSGLRCDRLYVDVYSLLTRSPHIGDRWDTQRAAYSSSSEPLSDTESLSSLFTSSITVSAAAASASLPAAVFEVGEYLASTLPARARVFLSAFSLPNAPVRSASLVVFVEHRLQSVR